MNGLFSTRAASSLMALLSGACRCICCSALSPVLIAVSLLGFSSLANAVYGIRFDIEAYDQNGNDVRAQIYHRTPAMKLDSLASDGFFGVRLAVDEDIFFGHESHEDTFIGDIRDPGCGRESGPPIVPGPGDYDTFTQHNDNAYNLGIETWGTSSCWRYAHNPVEDVNFGRQIVTKIFAGAADDAQGNWYVFDRIEEPQVTIENDCQPEYFVQGRQVTIIKAGDEATLGYSEPAPCDFRLKVTAIYRQVVAGVDNDGDGIPDADDNCPADSNQQQRDADQDGVGDNCDSTYVFDSDIDGVLDSVDNCRWRPNPTQDNLDGDSIGDVCDPDFDNDGFVNAELAMIKGAFVAFYIDYFYGMSDVPDNCPLIFNSDQLDSDGDGRGDACEGLPPGC